MSYNITPHVKFFGVVGILFIGLYAASALPSIGLVAAPICAVLSFGLLYILKGERLWIVSSSSSLIPWEIIVKPRGFKSSGFGSNSDGEEKCYSCNTMFDSVEDHFRSDGKHFCPECSQVGETVMMNYKEWFETTQDVKQRESAD